MSRFLLMLGLAALVHASETAPDHLVAGFTDPPATARPQAWWWWLETATNHAAITKDLEEMKAKGLSGCLILDGGVAPFGPNKWRQNTLIGETEIRYESTKEYAKGTLGEAPPGPEIWSPEWRENVRFAAHEAGRLGLDLGVFIGPAGCGGPWVTLDQSQQELIWNEKIVDGGAAIDIALPIPDMAGKNPTGNAASMYRDVAVFAVPLGDLFATEQVIEVTSSMDASGRLRWSAPPGKWSILRFGHRPTNAKGHRDGFYYIDHLSAEAFDLHWQNTVKVLLNEMTPTERAAFKYVECDSWEAGLVGWTKTFPAEFRKRRGYDLLPFMPVLAGKTVGSNVQSAAFRRDYELTISDLIAENHYAHQREVAHKDGLLSYAEAAGPHQIQADLLKSVSRCDIAMGEFWMPSPHRPTPETRFLLGDTASAAHVYGMNRVFAEAFTSVGPNWEETPFQMKAAGDQAFCAGLNWMCFHSFSHRPSLTDVPGLTHSAGTHFDRTITWWEQAPAFITYLSRCSYLLQQGLFVADVVYYHGDGIIGKKNSKQTARDLRFGLPDGYAFDRCNTEVLLTRMEVRDGRIVLPDGMSYRVLALLPEAYPLSTTVLRKLDALVSAGATVIGAPTSGISGLTDNADESQRLANRLWGDDHQNNPAQITNRTIHETLAQAGIAPDVTFTGVSDKGVITSIHRQTADADIYFLASRWQPVERVTASFRVYGKQPEMWDPLSGKHREVKDFRVIGDRTIIPLEFSPCGSMFIIFRQPISANKSGVNWVTYDASLPISAAWEVSFDPQRGGPEKVTFPTLTDWTTNVNPGIRFYSGTATYRTFFDLPLGVNAEQEISLDLGTVYELAEVRLNGHDLGVLWTRPFRTSVTGFLKATGNELEIKVVNLWPNRLIGDASLPEEQRFTHTNIQKFTSDSKLRPSGLIGPVTLLPVSK